ERAEHGVVLQEVRHRLRVADVVRGHELEVAAALERRPEEVAPDAPEPVDPDPDLRHVHDAFLSRFRSDRTLKKAVPRPDRGGVRLTSHAAGARVRQAPRASKAKRWRGALGGRTGKLRGRPSRSLHHTRDRGDGRGLNPPPDERGPAVAEYDYALKAPLDEL